MKLMFCFLVFSCSFQSVYSFDKVVGNPSNAEIVRRIQAFIPEDLVIVEAGAYDGYDTIELCHLLPQAKIHALEPVPELFDKSSKNLESFSNVKMYNYALSDKTGSAIMHLSEWKGAPGVVGMSSSLLPPKDHLKYAPQISFNNKIKVETTTIDDWAEKNDVKDIVFLRLDIQGNELNVLKASPKTLSTVKAILTEVEFVEAYEGQYLFEDVKTWLEAQRFELDVLFTDPGRWFGDALFIRK